ncbi:flagellar biosynthetic protein FliR [Maioricimonas sp. JC845]|uniref:flagellar biosynthetic protein FliR n=1 Tax=Maioricimonas sp. JC845 TaxID=3232138 RepID=UPI003457AA50
MIPQFAGSIDPAALDALTAIAVTVGAPLLLATARLAGLIQAAPVTGDRTVPLRLRLALAASLALLALPVVTKHHSHRGPSDATTTDTAMILLVAGEFLLGYLLGTGVRLILAGLQLAGHVIDPQAGLAIGQTWNPLTAAHDSLTGSLIVLAGLAAFLLPPFHGDLVLVAALLDSFAAIPVGSVVALDSIPMLLATWMQQSTSLALRIAAPFLATVSLVTLSAAFLARGSTGIARSGLAVVPRIVVSLLVLALSLAGAMDAVVTSVQEIVGWTLSVLETPHG